MVGVPGKFKGCETCRLRRVKCDNTKPHCKKCVDSGRECAGYEKPTVFIVGTVEDGGRCSSHPPRVVKPKKSPRPSPRLSASPSPAPGSSSHASSSSREPPPFASPAEGQALPQRLQLFPLEISQSAWDDVLGLSDGVSDYWVRIAALHLNLGLIDRRGGHDVSDPFAIAAVPLYAPAEAQSSAQTGEFVLEAQCLVHLEHDNDFSGTTRSVCFFPYEHNSSATYNNLAPWRDPSIEHHFVRRTGPEGFRAFPNHHFFVRVYRPNAIFAALLNRQPTFLSSNEWLTTPWEAHPRSPIDTLLDTVVLIPALLTEADTILPNDPTLARRLMAQDILGRTLHIERLLSAWEAAPSLPDSSPSLDATFFTSPSIPAYWVESPAHVLTPPQIPFADPFAFRDGPYLGAFAHTLRWAAQLLLRGTIAQLQRAIFAPVLDAYPPTLYPSLPPALQLSPAQYAPGELASNVCRGLDAALQTGSQPDLLLGPLAIAEAFYRSCRDGVLGGGAGGEGDGDGGVGGNGDGSLELLWCEGFRARMAIRGRDIAAQHVIREGAEWVELARY